MSGSLLNVPNAADVELALLAVDARGRPQALIGSIQLRGNGNPLVFHLPFNPETFNKHSRIELHGRANQAGRLILRLPPQPIARGETQALGELRLVNPRDGWPNEKARSAASNADHVIDAVVVFPDLASAVADLNFVFATTAKWVVEELIILSCI